MLTLREGVGLHDVQESSHRLEQDPDRPRFVMSHRLVNSRGHVAEIQLSRRGESPRLRVLLQFPAGRGRPDQEQEQEQDPARPHGARARARGGRQPGVKWVRRRGAEVG